VAGAIETLFSHFGKFPSFYLNSFFLFSIFALFLSFFLAPLLFYGWFAASTIFAFPLEAFSSTVLFILLWGGFLGCSGVGLVRDRGCPPNVFWCFLR